MAKIIYVDFQDGNGFIDISSYVKYDTLTFTIVACNDTFQYAQNQAQFTVIYESSLFNKFRTSTKDTLVRIVDDNEHTELLTDACNPILTDDGLQLLIDQEWVSPVFYGHIPPTHAHSYNGIMDNTMFEVEAVDELDLLDTPIGDIVLTDYEVYNPANPSASIIHYLAPIAGWSLSRIDDSIVIPTTIAKFAPQSTTDSVLDVMSALLFEYGYTLNIDNAGNISPVKWQISSIPSEMFEFNDENIVDSITESDTYQQYDGGLVTYFELGTSSKVRLFTDDNCTYGDDGLFTGYSIPNGYDYPPDANQMDTTTGLKQVVTQSYTDTAIKYRTNYAIKTNSDLNYKAFDSDFSAIVATANHFVDRKYDTGLSVVSEAFNNKSCRLLYRNTSGSSKLIYYNDVYGDVWYKSSERTIKVDLVTSPKKQYLYTMKYAFGRDIANDFIRYLMARYQDGSKKYTFSSEIGIYPGAIISINTGDGISCNAIIGSVLWNEKSEIWKYTCYKIIATATTASSQTASQFSAVSLPVIDVSANTNQITIPYNNGAANFSGAYIDITVKRDGAVVTEDWSYSATTTGVAGAFSLTKPYRYIISGISSSSASIVITASRTNWASQSIGITVVKGSDATAISSATSTAITTAAQQAPKYKGIGVLSATGTAAYISAIIDSNGVITTVGSATPNIRDYIVNYSGSVATGIYKWTGSVWTLVSDVDYISNAAIDLCNLQVHTPAITISGYTTFITAIVKTLFAQQIKLLTGGKLYSGSGNYNNSNTPLYIGADGSLSFGTTLTYQGGALNVYGTIDTDTAYLKADCQVVGQEYMKNIVGPLNIDLNDANVASVITALDSIIAQYGVPLYGTEDYVNDRRVYCSTVSQTKDNPIVMIYDASSIVRICNVIDRYTQAGVIKYDIGISTYTPYTSGAYRDSGMYRNIISGGSYYSPITPASDLLQITFNTSGIISYGSHYIDGCMTARRGVHQRKRGIRGTSTAFATPDDIFQFALYLFKRRGTSLGTYGNYVISCSVQLEDTRIYAGCIHHSSATTIELSYAGESRTMTAGDTSAINIRYIFI